MKPRSGSKRRVIVNRLLRDLDHLLAWNINLEVTEFNAWMPVDMQCKRLQFHFLNYIYFTSRGFLYTFLHSSILYLTLFQDLDSKVIALDIDWSRTG